MGGQSQPLEGSSEYRFGPFAVDLRQAELRKHGIRLRLQEKPFQILTTLLTRPGELVTREELRARLWATDTYVDFEHGLDTAVNKLRAALGDKAECPRYVETVRGKGYRLLGKVEVSNRQAQEIMVPPEATTSAPLAIPQVTVGGAAAGSRSSLGRSALAIGFIGTLLAAALVSILRTPAPPSVLESVQITRGGAGKGNELLTDGTFLYFRERAVDSYWLARVPVAGGTSELLRPIRAEDQVLALNPVRPEVLVVSVSATGLENAFWIYPLPSGTPRRLGEITGRVACWSPDGERIVYASRNDLFVANADGTGTRKLLSLSGPVYFLSWSADGQVIGFVQTDEKGKTESLAEVRTDGSRYRVLFSGNGLVEASAGTWTAGNRYFIFPMMRNTTSDLWAARDRTGFWSGGSSEPVRLTTGQLSLSHPVTGRDGKTIFALGRLKRVELLRYDAIAMAFVPYLPNVSADGLAFSSDGEWVAYTTFPELALWRSRVDGSDRMQLTVSPTEVQLPRWSPDGKRIAYMARSPGGHWKIHIISAQGGAPEQLLQGDNDEGHPSWSADGNAIMFGGVPWIHSFAPESTAIHRLDLRTRQVATLPGSEGLWSPRWSPDGRYLVAESIDSRHLRLLDLAAGSWSALADPGDAILSYSSWSRDSRYVYYNTFGSGDEVTTVYRVAIARRKPEIVVKPKGFPQAQTLGKWFALAPDDSPLLLRDASVNEVFALRMQFP
jgi:Tol biopolymer transport system component/DNA-binding winged helix-turn-helix (wHTH) protein